ncbi:Spore protein SP21 [Anatilimnocola aggregata]|uniref:Spore protein SP21 n=1 Tax=Anatilimnocola aggregata TaxID=2528021 RepID=A0A517YKC0_9BACT|nr:Hsp20/alpha crystallin family protein [Anatilimnocola aggregata]QDU30669.1 Spore protein SP21 [Anatilimnocola aggregata]
MIGTLATRRTQGLKHLRDEVEDVLGRFLGEPTDGWLTSEIAAPLDIAETVNAFELRLDAPAMNAQDFDIDVNGNVVTVRGERKEEKEEKGKTWHRTERRTGKFARTVTLPCNIQADEVAAEYTAGVLTVKLPKTEEARPKKIVVKAGQG